MVLRIFTILAIFLFASVAEAGLYWLTVADNDNNSSCAITVRNMVDVCEKLKAEGKEERCDLGEVLHTSTEVAEDLKRYFTGQQKKITILFPAFLNGHLTFCGNKEKELVHRFLVRLAMTEKLIKEKALFDIISIYASKYMQDQCSIEKKSVPPGSEAEKRLTLITNIINNAIEKRNKK